MSVAKQIFIGSGVLFALTVIIGSTVTVFGVRQQALNQVSRELTFMNEEIGRSQQESELIHEYIEAGDLEGAGMLGEDLELARLERIEAHRKNNRLPFQKRGEVAPAPSPVVAPVNRVRGAYYPGDLKIQEPEPAGPSWWAYGAAAGGGVLVFVLVGAGAFVLLRSLDPEDDLVLDGEPVDGDPIPDPDGASVRRPAGGHG